MGVTLHSLSLSVTPFSFCPLLADRPLPRRSRSKGQELTGSLCILLVHQNDPVWSHICRHSIIIIIIMAAPTSLYSLLPCGHFFFSCAPTQVNGMVNNTAGLFKLTSPFTLVQLVMCSFLEFRCSWSCIEFISTNWSVQLAECVVIELFLWNHSIYKCHLITSEFCTTHTTAGSLCNDSKRF